jgi:hypothetical protein
LTGFVLKFNEFKNRRIESKDKFDLWKWEEEVGLFGVLFVEHLFNLGFSGKWLVDDVGLFI